MQAETRGKPVRPGGDPGTCLLGKESVTPPQASVADGRAPPPHTMRRPVSGERDLQTLLRTAEPEVRPATFVFVVVSDESLLDKLEPEATIREAEGLTAVVRRERADALGLTYDYVAAWITLRVHSALDAVGLTAAVSTALARAGISCNVIAGFHHDHLLVPANRAAEALETLTNLARG
jgi:hypothetical protein